MQCLNIFKLKLHFLYLREHYVNSQQKFSNWIQLSLWWVFVWDRNKLFSSVLSLEAVFFCVSLDHDEVFRKGNNKSRIMEQTVFNF